MVEASGVQPILQKSFRVMLLPAVVAVLVFAVLPIVGMLSLSFTSFDLIKGWDTNATLKNYQQLAGDRMQLVAVGVESDQLQAATRKRLEKGGARGAVFEMRSARSICGAADQLPVLISTP